MPRIYVTEIDTDSDDYNQHDPAAEQPYRRAGWFTEERATYWHGAKQVFDGANRADVNTHDQNRGEGLYRTAQGRWVLRTWSNWQGENDTFRYVDDDTARSWLIFNGEDAAAKEHFGDIEEERGPGRPEIGGAALIRFGDQLEPLDAWAKAHSMTRAEAAREAVRRLTQDICNFCDELTTDGTRGSDGTIACPDCLDAADTKEN